MKFAKCCNPLPGDNIIGFITRGFGISIHKYDCKNVIDGLKNEDSKDRWVSASWSQSAKESAESNFDALLNVLVHDKIGMLAEVLTALAEMHVSILSISSHNISGSNDTMLISIKIRTKNVEHYNSILSRIKKIKNVIDVTR